MFDFGGGTLDISIVDAFDSVIEIVAVAGDNHLGGDDVNRAIAEKFLSVNRIDEGKITNEERASLIRESEKLKRTLTDAPEGEMEVVIGGQIYQMKLDAKGLLEVSAKLLEGIGIPLKRAMNDSGYGWEDIDEIIMIGGSGKMKIVQNYLQFLSGKRPRCEIDPDVAVAVGAGMYAGIKERQQAVRDVLLTDICPFTLGTEIIHGDPKGPAIMSPIIERNSVLPISRVERYWTVHQFQEYCDITILQGEHRYADQNLELGRIRVPVPLARREDQREAVDVRFTYDINGILEVDVTVVSTKEHFSKVIVNKDIQLTPEQIEERRKELQKIKIHPREQEKNRLLLERGDRLYEENTGEIRKYLDKILADFSVALNAQDLRTIEKAYTRTSELLDIVENTPKRSVPVKIEAYLYDEWRRQQ